MTAKIVFGELYVSATRLAGVAVDSAIGATDRVINIRAETEVGRLTATL